MLLLGLAEPGGASWVLVAVAATALVVGLVLWGLGRRVVKPGMVLAAGLCGAAGMMVLAGPAAEASGVPKWLLAGAGLVAGVILGVLLYRVAIGLVFGCLAAVLAAAVAAGATGLTMPNAHDYRPIVAETDTINPETGQPVPAGLEQAGAQTRAFRDWLADGWAGASEGQRRAVFLGSAAGFVVGGVVGALLPGWTVGLVTAAVGAAIWLPGAAVLGMHFQVPGHERLLMPPMGWLLVWACVTVIGVGIQWGALRKKKGQPAPAPAAGADGAKG
jgi:hypothetical protein